MESHPANHPSRFAWYPSTAGPGTDYSSRKIATATSCNKATTPRNPCYFYSYCYLSQPSVPPGEIFSLTYFLLLAIPIAMLSKSSVPPWEVLLPTSFTQVMILISMMSKSLARGVMTRERAKMRKMPSLLIQILLKEVYWWRYLMSGWTLHWQLWPQVEWDQSSTYWSAGRKLGLDWVQHPPPLS